MANEQKKYTPEVERLLAASRGLYDCATRAKLTPGLAIALRDGIPFDKLQVDEIAALARFCRELDKAATVEKPDAPAAEDAPTGNGNGAAVGEIVSKPDDKKPKGGRAAKNADPAT